MFATVHSLIKLGMVINLIYHVGSLQAEHPCHVTEIRCTRTHQQTRLA